MQDLAFGGQPACLVVPRVFDLARSKEVGEKVATFIARRSSDIAWQSQADKGGLEEKFQQWAETPAAVRTKKFRAPKASALYFDTGEARLFTQTEVRRPFLLSGSANFGITADHRGGFQQRYSANRW